MGNESLCGYDQRITEIAPISPSEDQILARRLQQMLREEQYEKAAESIINSQQHIHQKLKQWISRMRKDGKGYKIAKLAESIWLSKQKEGHDIVNTHFKFNQGEEPKKMQVGEKIQQNGQKIRYLYLGDFSAGVPNGTGTFLYENGDKYDGEVKMGKKHGFGIYYTSKGNRYEGSYHQDSRHGSGIYYWTNGLKEFSEYEDGKENGAARLYVPNGPVYSRIYKEGEKVEEKLEEGAQSKVYKSTSKESSNSDKITPMIAA